MERHMEQKNSLTELFAIKWVNLTIYNKIFNTFC